MHFSTISTSSLNSFQFSSKKDEQQVNRIFVDENIRVYMELYSAAYIFRKNQFDYFTLQDISCVGSTSRRIAKQVTDFFSGNGISNTTFRLTSLESAIVLP